MSDLLDKMSDIIAAGCGCDRHCEELTGADVYCGCRADAEKILVLVKDKIENPGSEAMSSIGFAFYAWANDRNEPDTEDIWKRCIAETKVFEGV